MVLPPHYYKPILHRHETVTPFFRRIASQISLPIVLYSMPKCVGFEIPSQSVQELSAIPSIIGIKDSSGDASIIKQFVSASAANSDSFSVLTGSGSNLLPHMELGAVGGILALANVLPEQCAELFAEYSKNGSSAKATTLAKLTSTINNGLVDPTGGWIPNIKTVMEHYLGIVGGKWGGCFTCSAFSHTALPQGECRDPLPRTTDNKAILSLLREHKLL